MPPELISLREFARRDRCDKTVVQRAIRDGRLKLINEKLDAAMVGTGWRETNRRVPPTAAPTTAPTLPPAAPAPTTAPTTAPTLPPATTDDPAEFATRSRRCWWDLFFCGLSQELSASPPIMSSVAMRTPLPQIRTQSVNCGIHLSSTFWARSLRENGTGHRYLCCFGKRGIPNRDHSTRLSWKLATPGAAASLQA